MGADQDWAKGTGWAIAVGLAAHTAIGLGTLTQQILTAGSWYQSVYTTSGVSGGSTTTLFGSTPGPARTTNATFTETNLANGASAGFSGPADLVISVDNVTFRNIITPTTFRVLSATAATTVDISVKATIVSGTQSGVVVNLDSITVPNNFVIAYHDGVAMHLDKRVGGTYTSLINIVTTYSANAIIRVTKSGTTYTLFYNGTQVGTPQTISDAGIISNTIHGIFSTHSVNTLDDFSLTAQ